MLEKEWMRFEHTGNISDYLAYSRNQKQQAEQYLSNVVKESRQKNGTDHYTYRYGAGSNPYRGL